MLIGVMTDELTPDRVRAFQRLMKEARERQGRKRGREMNQSEIGKEAGVSQALISSLERGPYGGMRFFELMKVARYYGISPNEIAQALGLYTPQEHPTQLDTLLRLYATLSPDKKEIAYRAIHALLDGMEHSAE